MSAQYLIRLDDACPHWDLSKWRKMESILNLHGVKPMVGIIPNCQDEKLLKYTFDDSFWDTIEKWRLLGWEIAMHGYNHVYSSKDAGINPFWHRSEFAGVPLTEQKEKIKKGVGLLREHGIDPHFFFAPSHTFDHNTIRALKEESGINIICDTVGRFPYCIDGMWFVPQFLGHFVEVPFNGFYTFCIHPNSMDENDFSRLNTFIQNNRDRFISFDDIVLEDYSKRVLNDKIMDKIFFLYRKLRGRL